MMESIDYAHLNLKKACTSLTGNELTYYHMAQEVQNGLILFITITG